jgi:hypothetical protein
VTRGVLTIGYQARSVKTRDAVVYSYHALMGTTRAVLREADTMLRRLSQRQRSAPRRGQALTADTIEAILPGGKDDPETRVRLHRRLCYHFDRIGTHARGSALPRRELSS